MVVRITERQLHDWRRQWPCSTLTTGYAVFDGGDLVDLGGRLARVNPDAHELTAFCDDARARAARKRDGRVTAAGRG